MILSDIEIEKLCKEQNMIEPFVNHIVRTNEKGEKIISYGLSSYGYDIRVAPEFKIFTNINNTIVDAKDFDHKSYVDYEGEFCIVPPNSFVLARTVEKFNMPPDVTGVCVGKSTYARVGIFPLVTPLEVGWCFTGDTKVALANGTSVSFKEMAERSSKGERFFGYTIGKEGEIEIAELMKPRKTKSMAELVEVTLDNDEVIRCTPNHKFLTKQNVYVEAKDLKENTALMPLYRYIDKKGYESVASPIYNKTRPIYTHKLSDNWNLKHGVYAFNPTDVRHHVDFNNANNYPTNIIRISDEEHHRIHETKERYFEERSRIGKYTWNLFLNKIKDVADFKDIIAERFSKIARTFWDSEEHKNTREDWLMKHKEPRPYRLKFFDKKQIWQLLLEHGSIRKAAKILQTKADTIVRRFPDLIALARSEGLIAINHKVVSVRKLNIKEDVYCLTVDDTHNFALDAGVFVHNCGYLTLEFANLTPLPAKLYANEGGCQIQFFKGNPCRTTYKDRNGKYQHQLPQIVTARV